MYFQISKKSKFVIYGQFCDDFCLDFRLYNFLQRQYSEMAGWIHLKIDSSMDCVLEMICVLSDVEKKIKMRDFTAIFLMIFVRISMIRLSLETVLNVSLLDSFETLQQYGLCSRDVMLRFRS